MAKIAQFTIEQARRIAESVLHFERTPLFDGTTPFRRGLQNDVIYFSNQSGETAPSGACLELYSYNAGNKTWNARKPTGTGVFRVAIATAATAAGENGAAWATGFHRCLVEDYASQSFGDYLDTQSGSWYAKAATTGPLRVAGSVLAANQSGSGSGSGGGVIDGLVLVEIVSEVGTSNGSDVMLYQAIADESAGTVDCQRLDEDGTLSGSTVSLNTYAGSPEVMSGCIGIDAIDDDGDSVFVPITGSHASPASGSGAWNREDQDAGADGFLTYLTEWDTPDLKARQIEVDSIGAFVRILGPATLLSLPVGASTPLDDLTATSDAADATTWSQGTNAVGYDLARVKWVATDNALYHYRRSATINTLGFGVAVSGETRSEIDPGTYSSPTSLAGSGTSADSTSWTRSSATDGLSETYVARLEWDDTGFR
jgi:hypothetical protein